MFDFNNQSKKDKYYARADAFLKENQLECFVIDKCAFGVIQNTYARINLEPFSKKTVTKDELARAKATKPFVVVCDRYSKRNPASATPLRETAYLLFELDVEDR